MRNTIAQVDNFDCLTDGSLAEQARDIVIILDRLTIKRCDDIAANQTRLVRRTAGRFDILESDSVIHRVKIIDPGIRSGH